ncbi:MAG: DNA-3-methyladenine glycosylase 2 family protein, partial [Frankiales bacterium]|nr:DNA-3-methyladenine glycosylase 2 family protein [Frankiales bacterium]
MDEAVATRRWRPAVPVSVSLLLGQLQRGAGDPTQRRDGAGGLWRTSLTPDGPASLRLTVDGAEVAAAAWGPGARWLLDQAPRLLGGDDDPTGFVPQHDAIERSARSAP